MVDMGKVFLIVVIFLNCFYWIFYFITISSITFFFTYCFSCSYLFVHGNQGRSQKFWFGGAELHIYIYIHLHSYIYIYILEIIIFINFNEYKQIVYFAINMYKNVLPLFNCNFFKSLIFGVISSPNIKYPLLIFFSFNIFCLNQALEKKLET